MAELQRQRRQVLTNTSFVQNIEMAELQRQRRELEKMPLAKLENMAKFPNAYQELAREILKERDPSTWEISQRQLAEEKEFKSNLIALNRSKNSYFAIHKILQAIEKDCVKWNLLPHGQEVTERFACRRVPRAADHQVKIREMQAAKQENDDAGRQAIEDIRALEPLRDAFAEVAEAQEWYVSAVEEIRAARTDSLALGLEAEPIANAELLIVHTPDVVSGSNEDKIRRLTSTTKELNKAMTQIGKVLFVQYDRAKAAGHVLPGLKPRDT